MRNILVFFFLLILFGCNKDGQYRINGTIQGIDTGYVFLGQLEESAYDFKKVPIKAGKFYFEGKIISPEDFKLFYNNSEAIPNPNIVYDIFIEPQARVNVILYPDSMAKSVIKGSKISKTFWRNYKFLNNEYFSKFATLSFQLDNAIKANNIDLQAKITHIGDSINTESLKWHIDYIKKDPNSFISAYYLFSIKYALNEDTLKKYYEILDASLAKSKYSKAIKSYLSVFPGNPFHDFELYDINDIPYKLSTLAKDKVTLIDFWASWCKPCRENNVKLSELYNKYKSKGFEIVGVSIDKNKADFNKAVADDKMTWVNLLDKSDETAVSKIYRSNAVPFAVLIDKNGLIIYRANDYEHLKFVIDSLLIN